MRELVICGLVALLAACALEDPCPQGTMRGAGRCVTRNANEAEAVDAGDDGGESDARDGAASDLGTDSEAPGTARDEAPDEDGGAQDGPEPGACAEEARDAWRRFQLSEEAVPAIAACYGSDPACSTGACDVSDCLKTSAQVIGCDRCVRAEVTCATEQCAVPCSVVTNDDACRACACANGCLEAPAGCGLGDPDACGDCSGASCSARRASSTDAITVPILFHLLHDRVDPETGLPAYADDAGEPETILDVDAQLAEVNSLLDAVRPDTRQLRVVRAGVDYVPAPATCPDPIAATDANRLFGALNIVLVGETASCPAATSSPYAGRASAATLLRTLGSLLGIPPADQGSEPWQVTPEQFLRMHNYARWRAGAAAAVPASERAASSGSMHGAADPIWDEVPTRDWALNNASVFGAAFGGPFAALMRERFAVPEGHATRRVLGVRVSAKVAGTPSESLQIVVTVGRHSFAIIRRSEISVAAGRLVAEDAFQVSSEKTWRNIRNRHAVRVWEVSISDVAPVTFTDVQVEAVLGDRFFDRYDRHARGSSDILMYRPDSSELSTPMNPANGSTAFGASVSDHVPPLPVPNARVFSGDVDGDGRVDLLARAGAMLWVSFERSGFGAWRSVTVEGQAQLNADDDVLMGDLDGDGFGDLVRRRADLAADASTWAFFRGVGDGRFESARAPVFAGHPYSASISWTLSDITRRGRSDIVVRDPRSGGRMWISYNTTLQPTTSGILPTFYGEWSPRIGVRSVIPAGDRFITLDANQDGAEDFVFRRGGSGEWFVALNEGMESFTEQRPMTIGRSSTAFGDDDTLVGAAP